MNKNAKVFRIVASVFLILALALAIAGTILMFCAEETVTSWTSYYSYRTRTVAYPEAGALPAVGTVILIVGLALIFAAEKKPKAAIGTMVSIFVSQAFLLSSVALISYDTSEEAWVGYWILLAASSLMVIAFFLSLFYLIFIKKNSGAKSDATRPTSSYTKRLYQAAEVLRELKDLYDNGVFTQAEYIRAKREAIERFEVYPIRDASAHSSQ